jgi:uncharacterized membrane protein
VNVHVIPRRPGAQLFAAWGSVVLLAVVWVYLGFGNVSIIREIAAVPLVLLVPGGLLVMMLPRCSDDPFFRLALSVGLSIALCIMVGLLLDILPTGIDRRTWECALGLVSVTEAVIVVIRRGHANESQSSVLLRMPTRADARPAIVAAVAALATLGGLIAIVAWQRSNAEGSYRQERFAELWVGPAHGGAALVGVHSDTSGRERLRLSVSATGRPTRSYTFMLNWQQTWSHQVSIAPGTAARVLISLFSGSSSKPSERVWYVRSSGT